MEVAFNNEMVMLVNISVSTIALGLPRVLKVMKSDVSIFTFRPCLISVQMWKVWKSSMNFHRWDVLIMF